MCPHAPGLEYSNSLTRFHVSRTTLSCASRAVSVSEGPAGLGVVSFGYKIAVRRDLPDGQIKPAAEFYFGHNGGVFRWVGDSHETTGLFQDRDSCRNVPGEVVSAAGPACSSRVCRTTPSSRLPTIYPMIPSPCMPDPALHCFPWSARALREAQCRQAGRQAGQLTFPSSSCRAPCRPSHPSRRAQQPCS